ncbi:MAG TPA: hypothetical protein VGE62_01160 [Candidatus Paceibacterota bacterium]
MSTESNSWLAEVKRREIVKDTLRVTVAFSKGDSSFDHVFETNQGQSDTWLGEMISWKIEQLKGIDAMSEKISEGVVDIGSITAAEEIKNHRAQYEEDLARFNKMVNATIQGIMSVDDPAFVELKQKLKAEFKPDYVDLF